MSSAKQAAPAPVSRETRKGATPLRARLAAELQGEVRFDDLSRALYATDASVYQIVPAGVVIPKTRDDVVRTVQLCAHHGCPITARGGGTSQAGQAIGPGIVLDLSKYLNRVLQINARQQWARVEPGVVLDELNAQLKPHGLMFAPDVSTANRATIGGMMANNSSGAHSIVYGKTIDHVLEQTVVLSDASVVELGPLSREEWQSKEQLGGLEGECYRMVTRLGVQHAEEIERRYPKILRRVGGYNLDAFTRNTQVGWVDQRDTHAGDDGTSSANGTSATRVGDQHGDEIERRYPKILRVGGYNLDAFTRNTQVGRVEQRDTHAGHGSDDGTSSANAKSTTRGSRPSSHPTATQGDTISLVPIMVGSEGTLGIVVEAKIRLVPLPRATALCVVHFDDLLDALAATPAILQHNPSAVEVVDKMILDSTRLNIAYARLRGFIKGDPQAILLVEFFGNSDDELIARLDALEAALRERGFGYHVHRASGPAEQKDIWDLRKAALGLSMRQRGDARAISFVEDTAVPPAHLRDYIERFLQIVAKHGTTAGVYAHASVGCLHVRPVVNLKTEDGVRQFESIAREVADLVLEFGGAVSGEHGDGLVRSAFQEQMFGPVLYEAFRELKRTFDPQGILNPGKIVDAPPLTENLRFGAGCVTPEVATRLDFRADGGLARSAELCSGVGACRKKREGTMCPSYMATREEQHSTRGRANALRLAIGGRLGSQGLNDPQLHDALDLCLECKACKTECPVGVDMAKLKYEFLSQYAQAHGLTLRARLLGNLERMARWGSRLAPVSNWIARSRTARWLQEQVFGLNRRRAAPRFARRTFLQWMAQREAASKRNGKRVVLFADTFMNHYEPEIGVAAVELFEAAGKEVIAVRPRCCGRPLISQGMLDRAAQNARENVEQLYPLAEQGIQIVGCEPSCLLALRDDYPDLVGDAWRQRASVVAAACRTFEEYAVTLVFDPSRERERAGAVAGSLACAGEDQEGTGPAIDPLARARGYGEVDATAPLRFRESTQRVLVHGHCHQKALVGMQPTMELLSYVPGCEVHDVSAGCCGMAGAFGYESEHYELSEQIAALRLLPALAEDPSATVIAPGFSCRHQIAHFAGRHALHPAVWLRALLDANATAPPGGGANRGPRD